MNINNGKTGNVNIPGPLHSTGGDGDGQVGGVVAYAGDVYDETLGKNQKEINQTLLDGSADSNVIAVALNDLNEKVEEQEKVTSSGLNDLNDKTDNLGKDIEDLEKTTSSSLNDLNEKIDNLSDEVNDNEKTTASALADLDEKTNTNEKAVSAALNDLNDKIDNAAQSASDILFNDNVAHLNVNNIQEAIDLLAANVSDNLTTLNINLKYANGTAITNKAVSVNVSFRGESHSTTGIYTTDSSGLISLSIPYGSIYSINYNDINDYQTPEPTSGSADIYTININGIYQPVSNTEKVIVTCSIRNGTSSPSGKKVYIDIYDATGTTLITEKAFTVTLNSQGLASTIIDSNNQTVNSCEVPNGNVYKVYAQPWDDTENPSYSVTEQQSFLASKYSRIVHFDYTYLNSGIFLMINNPQNSTDGYDSFKVKEIDDTNNAICIIDNNNEYWVYYESGAGIKRYLSNSSIENSYLWIEDGDINNKVLGIGFRNQALNVASNSNNAISGTCAFCMLFSSSVQPAAAMWESGATVSYTAATDGLYTTELYKDADHPTFAIALNYTSFKTQIGTRNQQAFIMAANQFAVLYNNFNTVKVICNAVNRVFDFMNSDNNYWTSTCNNIGNNGAYNSSGKAYRFNNSSKTLVNEPTGSSSKYFTFNSYKTFPVYSY